MSSTEVLRGVLILVLSSILLWTVRRAAGRLAPRAAMAPLVFLATRKPVLIVWALDTTGWLMLILPSALERGHDSATDFMMIGGIAGLCGLGLAVGVVGPAWMVVRAFTAAPTFALEPGETLLAEVSASHFLSGEARGGKLVLTDRRLGFRPHRFNVQLATWSVTLDQIRSLGTEGQRLLLVGTSNAKAPEWIVTAKPAAFIESARELTKRPDLGRPEASRDRD